MVVACIGLGANLGDAPATVREAIQALAALPDCRLLAASRLYRTPAWGNQDQPEFINAAAA
ncbi:MAG TPA: 2-amino-4-hydroxy-6-hydroxymethyldihydropteridine diphosphokinase, partial [Stenotrophomonas sp.]|nr:2-amino-4-hydroxy-6-hydroxymethyldihydropteridine diphosphokinase [Stenotrophomonas sp.]